MSDQAAEPGGPAEPEDRDRADPLANESPEADDPTAGPASRDTPQSAQAGTGGHPGRPGRLNPIARAGFIEYDRVLFFSDAVFAIAITLLAVNLRVTDSHLAGTLRQLDNERPSLIGFWISFAVIGLFWLGHHGISRYIKGFDRRLMALNLLFLGTIAFLPYPTEVLSRAPGNSTGATVFYALCGIAAGLAETAMWIYAIRSPAGLTTPAAKEVRLLYTLRVVRVPVVFALSIPVAFVAPRIATLLWLLIWPSGILINRLTPAS